MKSASKVMIGIMIGTVLGLFEFLAIATIGYNLSSSHFYVRSVSEGYLPCINHGSVTMCVGKAMASPIDADIVVKELNRDMEGHWEK